MMGVGALFLERPHRHPHPLSDKNVQALYFYDLFQKSFSTQLPDEGKQRKYVP
jgi:hypothetical protein